MEQTRTFKDRKKLNLDVKKEFQRWMLMQVLIAVGISAVVAAVILYFYARQEVVGSFFDAHIKLRRVSDLLLPVVLSGSVVSLISGAALALFLPQKIAGPLYRVEMGLKSVEEGDLSITVKLRENDTLKDFAGRVDETITTLRSRVRDLKTKQDGLEQAISGGQKEEIAKCLAAQREILDRIKT